MDWRPLISRKFDLDWPRFADRTLDPYVVWADASAFTQFERAFLRVAANPKGTPEPAADDPIVSVAFEVKLPLPRRGSKPYEELKKLVWPPLARVGARFATSALPVSKLPLFFDAFSQRYFPRVEFSLPLPVPPNRQAFQTALMPPEERTAGASGATRSKVFAAVIDDGCAFANAAFLAPSDGTTRISRLWFQEDRSVDGGGSSVGFTARDLDRFLINAKRKGRLDEAAAYAGLERALRRRGANRLADDWRDQMRAGAAHGTHVLDTMAGNKNPLAGYRLDGQAYGQEADRSSGAPIIFVQLPRSAIADTSGSSMTSSIFEALAFIGSAIGKSGGAIVNLSYGALAGPHDGTTLLEEAIDHLLDTDHKRFLSVVLPAGNGYDSRTHARVIATRDARWHEMSLHTLPDDPTDTFVELWYAVRNESGDAIAGIALDVEVMAPDGTTSGPLALDQFFEWGPEQGPPMAALMHLRKPIAGGGRKHMVLLALAPTSSVLSLGRSASPPRRSPHGVWRLRVRNRGGASVPVDAWIERDDSAFGSGRSRSQATFLSEGHASAPGDPHAATNPISRDACLNSFAHGRCTLVVGGCAMRPVEMAQYSASGPGKRGHCDGPDIVAPCEDTPGSAILAAGTRSAQPAYMNGTSVSAAAFSRQLINASQVRSCLPEPDATILLPRDKHPDDIAYPEPALRRGRGLLKPMPG